MQTLPHEAQPTNREFRQLAFDKSAIQYLPKTLSVQVTNNHMFTQNLYYSFCFTKPRYLVIGYLDPLGDSFRVRLLKPPQGPAVGLGESM